MDSIYRRSESIRGQALIGLIIAIAIILSVTAFMYGGRNGGVYSGAIQRANLTACGEYTSQIHQAIMMYHQDYGTNPPSLQALSKYGVTAEMYNSPGCVYSYDPSSGHLYAPNSMRPGDNGMSDTGGGEDGDGGGGHHHHDAQQSQPNVVVGNGYTPPGSQPSQPAPPAPPSTTVVGPGGMSIKVPTGP